MLINIVHRLRQHEWFQRHDQVHDPGYGKVEAFDQLEAKLRSWPKRIVSDGYLRKDLIRRIETKLILAEYGKLALKFALYAANAAADGLFQGTSEIQAINYQSQKPHWSKVVLETQSLVSDESNSMRNESDSVALGRGCDHHWLNRFAEYPWTKITDWQRAAMASLLLANTFSSTPSFALQGIQERQILV